MKKITFIILSALFISCGSQNSIKDTKVKAIANPTDYAKSITESNLKNRLYTYASDKFEGRETGTPGQYMAIEYIKKQYQNLGITSPIDGYFQEVPLIKAKAPIVSLKINETAFSNNNHFISFSQSKDLSQAISEVIYLGYGIDSKTYSDYKNQDVKGKFILIKSGEPKKADGNYVLSGTDKASEWSQLQTAISIKTTAAKKHGAKGVFFYVSNKYSILEDYSKMAYRRSMKLADPTNAFYSLFIDETIAKAILPTIETMNTSKKVIANIDFTYQNTSEKLLSQNVLAHIKGSEKPNEYIVISAHLDHLGTKDNQVFNGADDDGSGTVAVLEIAKAFQKAKKAGHGPKRSILFLHVTGEEKGLLGSRHYTDNDPIIPLENTVADLNIDMIGRIDPKRKDTIRNYLYLIGADKLSTALHNISENVNKKYCNIKFDYTFNDENDPNRFYYRSDHYNFAKNNIPVIFYFNGTHNDYHQVSDTPDKIEYDLLENRTRLIFYTAWELANREERIIVDKEKK